jgi:hypothetical protein
MPRGPKGEKCPPTPSATMVAKIATGKIEDITSKDGKNAAAGAHRREGVGEGMTAKPRKEMAKKAAIARWGK